MNETEARIKEHKKRERREEKRREEKRKTVFSSAQRTNAALPDIQERSIPFLNVIKQCKVRGFRKKLEFLWYQVYQEIKPDHKYSLSH